MKGSLVSQALAVVLGECGDNDKAAEYIVNAFRHNHQLMWKFEELFKKENPIFRLERWFVNEIIGSSHSPQLKTNKYHAFRMISVMFHPHWATDKSIYIMCNADENGTRRFTKQSFHIAEDHVEINDFAFVNPAVCAPMADATPYNLSDMQQFNTIFQPFFEWLYPILYTHIEKITSK